MSWFRRRTLPDVLAARLAHDPVDDHAVDAIALTQSVCDDLDWLTFCIAYDRTYDAYRYDARDPGEGAHHKEMP